ncbi:MAG: putative PLP-dependent enzyme involved in cell wall biosis [Bacteroidetes bacterium]|nr:putative PLP-dependent enzyme involved in cell wall biosis [Bacteroidota bacterium]
MPVQYVNFAYIRILKINTKIMEKLAKKIQMVDLKSQYEKIKPEVDAAIQNVLNNTAFINGPEVKSFQAELEAYLGVKHVIPCANGTDALQIAMMALDLKPGDEIITADFTYVATAEVIALLGLKPVLVDVIPNTFDIDIKAIEKAITPKTKAIVPVHLFGQCANMEAMMALAKKHNLYVIEDTAQAIGAEYLYADGKQQKAGTIGTVGCTSFFPSKNLGCYGDGGALFTNDDALAAKIRIIANHGQSAQYIHDSIGVNSRLDSIQAAILRIKLRDLDNYAAARNIAAATYDKAFANNPKLKTPERAKYSTHVFHQYTLQLSGVDRNALREFLASRDIPAMIYYPIPLHLQKAYLDPRYKEGDFPVTEQLCASVVSLPMHTELDAETLNYITASVLEFVNK